VNLPRPPKIPRSVLVVIHTPALEVLLLERADRPGYWQSVTGSLDAEDEALEATARREVLEETGIAIDAAGGVLQDWQQQNVYEIYATWRHRYAPGVTHNTEHVFGLTVPRATPVVLAPREHLAFAWLPWEAAAARCFSPSNAEAIRQLPLRQAPQRP
jgi:dATP pyrophosphohydrolase